MMLDAGPIEILISAILVVGGFFALVGSWGLARMPSLMTRLHGPTKVTTLGVGSCLIASMIYFPATQGKYSAHELLITLFLFLTAPITANMIAKAHLHRQGRSIDPNPMDDIAEGLPETGLGTGWATFEGQDAERADPPR
ncbi:Na+/H+ antiporter subunit G [Phenylobacterium sp.]|uniref:Na+/H+ antiporter subunit G n=1 Tax=Phenylobacterium sp. TaxID=1871053 RepID=UPI0027306670|nr:Na+/H+ antiporter subunit G [Phenylobacterium sp.]MDP1873741.1 Na+/H+ antiporter subunit G [Phenylobacterium sp.]